MQAWLENALGEAINFAVAIEHSSGRSFGGRIFFVETISGAV